MALEMHDSTYSYLKYLKENNSQGICYGIVLEWIVNIMNDKAIHYGPPGHYSGKAKSRHEAFSEFYHKRNGVNYDHQYSRKVFQEELGLPVTAKKTKKYLCGSIVSNNDVKRLLLRVTKMKGKNVACNMTWRFASGGHVVGVFKDKTDGEIYFYDPNVGVYLWKNTGVDIYHDIKTHVSSFFGPSLWLQTIAMTETTKDVRANTKHLVF